MGLLESKYDNDDSQADRVGDVMMAWLRANDPRPDMMKIHELAVERLQECYAETIRWVDRAGGEP